MPNRELVERALEKIKRSADYHYFFERIQSPDWIRPLADEGLFKEPPQPEREGGYIRFPAWPESRYLVRMASLAPEIVLEVVERIPETENVRVHEDMADAALAMPAELAVQLVVKAKEWATSPYQLLLPEKVGALVSHLFRGGFIDEGVELAEVLLAVQPDPRLDRLEANDEELPFRITPEPVARFDQWQYERLLEEHLDAWVELGQFKVFDLMSRLLHEALKISTRGQQDAESDYSYFWRPAIEDDPQNAYREVRDLLVTAVRDVAVRLAAVALNDVVRRLETQPFEVFTRIALHVLRVTEDTPVTLVAERVTNPDLIDGVGVFHEFWFLVRDGFLDLVEDDRDRVLALIEQGPDVEERRERTPPTTDEELSRYIEGWKFRRLSILRDVLPPDWKRRLIEMERAHGKLEHPEFLAHMGPVQTGPNSPFESAELSAMSVDELVGFLREWRPSGDWMAPSPEGLSRQLSALVAAAPEKFAAAAVIFRELDPTYVRGLVQGLEQAQKAGHNLSWGPILELAAWVVEQPREIPGRESRYADLDPGWVWTRKAIASLLSAGFDSGGNEMPREYRQPGWSVLLPITEDPEPSPEYEAKYGDHNMEPLTLSINTTRGEAMHAVVRYGLWVHRSVENQHGPGHVKAAGFDLMPEVREVLEKHLAVTEDPSLAIRGVYGRWFPWLILLDRKWAQDHVRDVFPSAEDLAVLRSAAWNTYIVWCRPYDSSFEVLYDEYAFAIEHLPSESPSQRRAEDPHEHLAEHIITYYWQGKLPLDDEDNLLGRLFTKASASVRGRAIEFAGRTLWNSPGEVLDRILDRLQQLWEQRLQRARDPNLLNEMRAELSAFGWWIASAKFDQRWMLQQLEEVLRLVGEIDADHLAAERLREAAAIEPLRAMTCMRLMVEGDKKGWGVIGWRDTARNAIASALSSADEEARRAAEDVVHALGARGYSEFRELLRKSKDG